MASSPEPVTTLDKPLSSLSGDAYITLCYKLTVSQGVGDRNWKGVAGKIGFKMDYILAMDKHPEPHKGQLLLTIWESLNKPGATVKKLVYVLQSLKMMDCIDALYKDPAINGETTFIYRILIQ